MARDQPPTPTRARHNQRVQPTYGGGKSNTTLHATNGARECARRRRQIAAGSLKFENGLAIPAGPIKEPSR